MVEVDICVIDDKTQSVLAECITGRGNTKNAAGWAAWLGWRYSHGTPVPNHTVLILNVRT